MGIYTCPTCGQEMERDVQILYKHTDQHIVEEIRKAHPKWVTKDGFCRKCVDYYKNEMKKARGLSFLRKSGDPSLVNIGIGGVRLRTVMGGALFIASLIGFVVLVRFDAPQTWRAVLFLPFFGSMLCLIQARREICVVLAHKGTRETGGGEEAIPDKLLQDQLRAASRQILLIAFLMALLLTLLALWL